MILFIYSICFNYNTNNVKTLVYERRMLQYYCSNFTMKRKLISMILSTVLIFNFISCSSSSSSNKNTSNTSTNKVISEVSTLKSTVKDEDTKTYSPSEADTTITLGKSISIEGDGAKASNNNTVTITKEGIYSVSGTLSDGQIIIDAPKSAKIELLLNGVDITSTSSAAIYQKQCKKLLITLVENTENTLSDSKNTFTSNSSSSNSSTDNPNGTLYCKDDLTIKGSGNLTVNGKSNNAIVSKDDIRITGGNITVVANNNGIKGKDSVELYDGTYNITSSGDGIKSDNTKDEDKGYILIDNGKLTINSDEDGIQADNSILILNGEVNITSGGDSKNAEPHKDDMMNGRFNNNTTDTTEESEETVSTKGIKSTNNLSINGGSITIDSCDDAIHSDTTVTINNGTININSGDDGIHADSILSVNDGTLTINESYEGLESAVININGGKTSVTSSDDGVNASDGYLYVNADGDGLDSNGDLTISGGTVIVYGPTNDGNTALDYDSSLNLNGGLLLAAGSSGMLEMPSNSSKQNSIVTYLTSQNEDTIVNVTDSDGNIIAAFAPEKSFSSVIISSQELKTNSSYTISLGGTSTAIATDVIGRAVALQKTPNILSAVTLCNGRLIKCAILLPNVAPTKNVGLPLPPWKTEPKATAVNNILNIKSKKDTEVVNDSLIYDVPSPL